MVCIHVFSPEVLPSHIFLITSPQPISTSLSNFISLNLLLSSSYSSIGVNVWKTVSEKLSHLSCKQTPNNLSLESKPRTEHLIVLEDVYSVFTGYHCPKESKDKTSTTKFPLSSFSSVILAPPKATPIFIVSYAFFNGETPGTNEYSTGSPTFSCLSTQ